MQKVGEAIYSWSQQIYFEICYSEVVLQVSSFLLPVGELTFKIFLYCCSSSERGRCLGISALLTDTFCLLQAV